MVRYLPSVWGVHTRSQQGKGRLFRQNQDRQLVIRIGDLAGDFEVETIL